MSREKLKTVFRKGCVSYERVAYTGTITVEIVYPYAKDGGKKFARDFANTHTENGKKMFFFVVKTS